jgi:hypothetical protein
MHIVSINLKHAARKIPVLDGWQVDAIALPHRFGHPVGMTKSCRDRAGR